MRHTLRLAWGDRQRHSRQMVRHAKDAATPFVLSKKNPAQKHAGFLDDFPPTESVGKNSVLHAFNHGITKRGAAHFFCTFHQTGKVIGHHFVANCGFH